MTKKTVSNVSCCRSQDIDGSVQIGHSLLPESTISEPTTFMTKPTKHTIPASHAHAVALKAGTSFRLIDLYGKQVIDMSAFVVPFPPKLDSGSTSPETSRGNIASAEHLSASYTRFHTSGQPITIGESIYTNMDRPLLRLTHDDVKTHDMTFMSCYPKLYESRGFKSGEHRSCASNMVEAFTPFGMRHLSEVRDPFNVFQNTPNYSLKPLNTSRAGDWCQFEVLIDCVVGWSCCPFDLDGFNGGRVTDVMVLTGLKPGEDRTNEELMRECTGI